MNRENLPSIRRRLLKWYDKVYRDLPWRRRRDPYAIWIAETMLQQTQVATVVPYFERFVKSFPTVRALNRAPLSNVLALWSGLGYYRRAENLKHAARKIVLQHKGRLPTDYETLLSLPGVGDYTAGALMSIAFGQRFPALDGNAYRVLSRYFGLDSKNAIRKLAGRLVPRSRPGYFNQGVMELGATVCLAKKPRCSDCPIAPGCKTRESRRWIEPLAPVKTRILKDVVWPLVIVRKRNTILLRLRSSDGLLRRLWELPGGETRKRPQAMLQRQLRPLGSAVQRLQRIGEIRHSITDRRIRVPLFLVNLPSSTKLRLPRSHWRWAAASSLHRHPISSMTHKAAKALAAYEKDLS